MKKTLIYGWHTVLNALQNMPYNVCSLFIQEGINPQKSNEIEKIAKTNNISWQLISRSKLDALLDNSNHQGIAAYFTNRTSYNEADLPTLLADITNPFVLLLDGVQDPHNLGACLRTANAAGVNFIIIPKDNSVDVTPVVSKVASGAAEVTPVVRVTNLVRAMQLLKEFGVWLYGATLDTDVSLYDIDLKGGVGIVLGAEGKGLRRLTRENCDQLVKIPMLGDVASLNVSVATGVVLFEVCRQRR